MCMKKIILFYFYLPLLFFLFLSSCVKIKEGEQKDSYIISTKTVVGSLQSFEVTSQDIANYISYITLEGTSRRSHTKVKDVIPITWNGATCLYVIVFEKGYEIISADKRSPHPLVKADKGTFEYPTEETPLGFHLFSLAEDVWFSLYQNELLNEPDNEIEDNIESSLLFWKLINSDDEAIQKHDVKTKNPLDSLNIDPNSGHWVMVSSTTQTEVYDTSAHLTTTWWDQWFPFNYYCPHYNVFHYSSRCPAGCVAIAAAQMLYFLHYKIGVPEESPSTGFCGGYVVYPPGESYTQSFGDLSSETWDNMRSSTDPSHYAAMLIGDIGMKLHMQYTDTASYAISQHLRDSVFHPYGIHCSNINYYSGSFLKGNLENGFPVICSGFTDSSRSQNGVGKNGHCFIVDRYIRYQDIITITYEWVFDDPTQSPGYPIIRTTLLYQKPKITHYQMNWGQGQFANYDDVWCSMNGAWQYGNNAPYSHDRSMIFGFSPL